MAYNPYGGPGHYGQQPPPNYNPYPGHGHGHHPNQHLPNHPNLPQGPGMGYPPPGMSPAAAAAAGPPPGMGMGLGMAPPPGIVHHQPSAQANRPSGYGGGGPVGPPGGRGYGSPGGGPPGGYGGPPGAPRSNGIPTGPSGASSLPARPNIPTGPSGYSNGIPTGPSGNGGGRRRDDTPLSAHSNGTPIRPDFGRDRFGGGGGGGDRYGGDRYGDRDRDRNDRSDRERDRGDRDRGDRNDRDRGDRDRDRDRNGIEQARAAVRDTMHSQAPPTNDEKLRTIFVHKVPSAGVGGEAGLQQLLSLAGRLRRFDAGTSHLEESKEKKKNLLFAFAQYEDANALASAISLLKDVYVPVEKQEYKEKEKEKTEEKDTELKDGDDKEEKKEDEKEEDDDKDDEKDAKKEDSPFKGIKRTQLQVSVDPVSLEYIEAFEEKQSDDAKADAKAKQEALRPVFEKAIHNLFFPPKIDPAAAAAAAAATSTTNANGDVIMTDIHGIPILTGSSLDLEALNLPLGGATAAAAAAAAANANQEDELADVPAEMREMVASEIASFRDRSTQRDLERLKREQEMEELERRRNGEDPIAPGGSARLGRLESPGTNNVPVGPRRRDDRDRNDRDHRRDDRRRDSSPDTEASDDELYRREQRRTQADDDRLYSEAERKWATRERQRAAALEREKDRERAEIEREVRYRAEALERDAAWDDEREASRKNVLYYRDHAAWLRKRAHDRADEEARDAADRRAEQEEQKKQAAAMEAVKGQADSFLDGMGTAESNAGAKAGAKLEDYKKKEEKTDEKAADKDAAAAASSSSKVTISFGAAAQRNQAQRGTATLRRTVADVEGLLDDGEHEGATKRQLVPIKFEPMAASARMSDEEINEAVRALVQEIPTTQEGLWAWPVEWTFMDEAVVRDKLRPFVEKKVVEYLGVQEQFLVEVVEEHLRKHGGPQELVEELQEALDEAAEDLVKKLWRMVIFFTESEKRGLPA